MLEHDLYPTNQSSYRRFHSTETALLKVRNDILQNMNQQRITLLVLLDFGVAFDTVNHSTLLGRLQSKLGLRGTALAWLKSYLSGRSQHIVINGKLSRKFPLNCGVPQGSYLGPLLFNIYLSSLFEIIDRHFPDAHLFADLQLYLSFSPSSSVDEDSAILAMHNCVDDIKNWAASNGLTLNEDSAILALQNCVADIKNWATSNGLMLNDDKTEFVVIGTRQQLCKINVNGIKVGNALTPAASSVRNLGAWFDETFSMNTHVTETCSASFFHLHNIRRIHKYLTPAATETLIHAFVTSRIDYCNSLMYGLPAYQLAKIQRVQNAAARLILNESKFCHKTPLLKQLHWLPVTHRIRFKLLLMTFKAVHGLTPQYIKDLITIKTYPRYKLKSSNSTQLQYPNTKSLATLGDRSFMWAAPRLWNALPATIRNITCLETFKKHLKTLLFSDAFF